MRTVVDAGTVEVGDAPAIPGLRFRRFAGDPDLPAIAEVHNASRRADDFDLVVTPDGVRVELEHLPNADPYRDVLLAEIDGRVVAVTSRWWAVRDGMRSYEHEGSVLPEHRGRGIGRAMLRTNEAALRGYADADPEGHPGVYATWTVDSARPTADLLLAEGYRPARHFFEMGRPSLDEVPMVAMPAGLEIRPVGRGDVRRVIRAEDEAFRDHWGHRDLTDADIEGIIAHPDFDPSLLVVAWDGDEVAGVVTNMIYPAENETLGLRRGWLERVSVRRPWRRRGLATALVAESLRLLRERRMTSAALGVDTENPSGAVGLYERLGFEVVSHGTLYRKPLDPRT